MALSILLAWGGVPVAANTIDSVTITPGCGPSLTHEVEYTVDCPTGDAYWFATSQLLSRGNACVFGAGTFTRHMGFPPEAQVGDTRVITFNLVREEDGVQRRKALDSLAVAFDCATGDPVACPAAPLAGCRSAGKSVLLAKDREDDTKDTLIWKWIKGEATTVADFGSPTSGDVYHLCAYAGDPAGLWFDTTLVQTTTHISWPEPERWSPLGPRGFRYRDAQWQAFGMKQIALISGPEGKAKITLAAKGTALPDPGLQPDLPVVVQLSNRETGTCFESTFDAADIRVDQTEIFKAVARTP